MRLQLSRFSGVAKLVLSVVLIWLLFTRVDLHDMQDRLMGMSPGGVLAALLLLALQAVAAAARWDLVCRIMSFPLPLAKALRLTAIGLFFNQTLPSSIGGDAVRIWLATREGATLTKAINVVLGDRLLALFVLIGLMGATLPLLQGRISDPLARLGVIVIVAGGVLAAGVLLVAGRRIGALLHRFRVTRPFGDLISDLRSLFQSSASVVKLSCWSIFIHLTTIASIEAISASLNVTIHVLDALVIVPAVILVTTLPISVAGWGLREGAMVFGLGQVGVTAVDALAISICFGLLQVVVGLPGGAIWLLSRPRSAG